MNPALILTGSSLGNPDLATLINAAADAGFTALSIWPPHEYEQARVAGYSDADLRSLLSARGLTVNDVDALVAWAGPDDPGGQYLREAPADAVLATADALGARAVNVLIVGEPGVGLDALAEAFARVCDRAADHGLIATLEFIPPSVVTDLGTARRVVELAGRRNGSLLVDTCHLWTSGWPLDELAALGLELLDAVQLGDLAVRRPTRDAERGHERLVPGEGDLDLVGLLRALPVASASPVLSVEVFNRRLARELGPRRMAHRLAGATRAVLARASPVPD